MSKKHRLVGVLFISGALLCGLVALYASIRAANRVRGLKPITAVILEDMRAGEEVLVEGRVSSRNPTQSAEFVAYVREVRTVDEEGDTGTWSVRERVTPPLLLELPDGLVRVENDDYELQDAHVVEVERAFGEPSTTRYKGLAVGDPVVAVGVSASRVEIPQIEADFVARGTRERYIARRRSGGLLFCAIAVVVAAVGGVILTWDWKRGLFST